MYVVCRTMGWDFHTYMAQPTWFIDEVKDRMRQDMADAKQ